MPNLMRAAVVHAFDQALVIEQVPIPSPGPGQVLVKIEASGVCHTDLHAARGDWPIKPALPFIPGHEGAGFVAALGAGVEGFQEGERVGIPWLHSACGRCSYCVGGWETLCQAQTNTGYSVNGGFAEYALAEAAYAAPIPATISLTDAAPILCAGVTTYKALKETGARPGEWVLISGIGGLGHMAVQYARAMGLRVVAMDVTKEKLSLAHELGAEIMIDARSADAATRVQSATGGVQGAVVTAVCAPAFRQALDMVRRGGTCVLVGLPPGDFSIPIFDVVLKRLTIRGSIVGTRNDLAEAFALATNGGVTARYEVQPLECVNTVFERMQSGVIAGRVVLGMR